ncbi:MAG: hypothetical protein VYD87_10005 [Pseudomonadota bacterium]|nr:hypothetical protein [Pseudomonadota bacterium]
MRDLSQLRPPARRAGALTDPSPRIGAAERDDAVALLLTGGLGGLEMSVERWLDRMEAAR